MSTPGDYGGLWGPSEPEDDSSAVRPPPPPPTSGWAQPPAYGQQYPPQYAPPGYYGVPPAGYAAPDHPSANTSMVLGLVGLIGAFLCGLPIVLCPFAWAMGARAKREIDASGGSLGGRDKAQVGYVTGILGTVLLVLGMAGLALLVALAFAAPSTT